MYRTEQKYKIKLNSGIWYTGFIIEEDDQSIKIKTIRDETLIISKRAIDKALEVQDDD